MSTRKNIDNPLGLKLDETQKAFIRKHYSGLQDAFPKSASGSLLYIYQEEFARFIADVADYIAELKANQKMKKLSLRKEK